MKNNIFDSSIQQATLARINNLSDNTLPLWGKMNVNQVICHMTDPLRDFLNLRQVKPAVPRIMAPLLRLMILTNSNWKPGTPTLKIYDQLKELSTKPTHFESDKNTLVDLFKKLSNTDENYSFGAHPALGNMKRDQLGFFVWKHSDHHLRQFGV
ncbi:MAG: DUF1569 domain-containing protein [Saprospiraceae bacterium]